MTTRDPLIDVYLTLLALGAGVYLVVHALLGGYLIAFAIGCLGGVLFTEATGRQ